MRVLWLSTTPGLYKQVNSGYNGIGWISSVQSLIQEKHGVELALAFLTSNRVFTTDYYSIFYR